MKRLWLDTETTGLDPIKNGVIQIGALIEIDGEVVETFNERFQPFPDDKISEKALEINGTTENDVWRCSNLPTMAYEGFVEVLRKHVDQYDSKDKFVLAGYNCKFDDEFMREWFVKNDDKFWGSYVKRQALDLLPVMIFLHEIGLVKTDDVKLETASKLFNIKHDAHDALSDAKATYELYGELKSGVTPWDAMGRSFWNILNMGKHMTEAQCKADDAYGRSNQSDYDDNENERRLDGAFFQSFERGDYDVSKE